MVVTTTIGAFTAAMAAAALLGYIGCSQKKPIRRAYRSIKGFVQNLRGR